MNYSIKQRQEMAKLGQALPDGSYPIKTRTDVKNAIHLVGLGNTPEKVIKDHIIKRAKAIGALSMIPPKWIGSEAMPHSDILEHHGTKGMKWGIRKDQGHAGQRATNKKIAKLDTKFAKNASSNNLMFKIYNNAVPKMNQDVNRINDKPQYRTADFTHDSPLRRKYYGEIQRASISRLNEAAQALGTNASGTQRYGVVDKGDHWDVVVTAVSHADNPFGRLNLTFDDTGHIVKIVWDPQTMMQTDLDEAAEAALSHFGVKGMKWGIRRSHGGGMGPASADAKRAAAAQHKIKTKGRQSLTNKELKDLVNRMNLEQQHSRLSEQPGTIKRGHAAAKEVLAIAGTAGGFFALAHSPMGKAIFNLLKNNVSKVSKVAETTTALAVGA